MPIVTLTTDFGTRDGYVGALKGVICTRAPAARIVDIAHDVPRHDIASGAYVLAQAAPYFPIGTIHVVVVDPGVGSARAPVIVDAGEQRYVGPDNGVLALVAPAPVAVFRIEAPEFVRETRSATFHGRDVFAPAAAALARGAQPSDAGPPTTLSTTLPRPAYTTGGMVGVVVHIDGYGNVITDFPGDRVPAGAILWIAGRQIIGLSRTFTDVARGQLVAYVGSGATLEIAVREGSAADELGIAPGALVAIEPR